MNTFDLTINNIVVPALVSLVTSLVILGLSSKQERKCKFQDEVSSHCALIQKAISRREPYQHEEDMILALSSITNRIKVSRYLKEPDMQKVGSEVINIKHLFTELTDEKVTEARKSKVVKLINDKICSILALTDNAKINFFL